MAMSTKFPDAERQLTHCLDVEKRLSAILQDIKTQLAESEPIPEGSLKTLSSGGDYYSAYEEQKNNWVSEEAKIRKRFAAFIEDLENSIQEIQAQGALWSSRVADNSPRRKS
jgi:hypothetical protein